MTRADCENGPRPCPLVSCRYNLYLEVSPISGNLKLAFPDLRPEDMEHSCSLDVADRGEETLDSVGGKLNLTRERVRQIELRALLRLRAQKPNR